MGCARDGSASWALTPAVGKARAIDAVALPAGFNGILAYGRHGHVERIRCVGIADIEAGRPVTLGTQFKLGSASKWLTSVAVMRLAERGRLSLDAPITAYPLEFHRDTSDRVRADHLLSNTSSIPDLLSRQIRAEPSLRTSDATAQAIVARFGGGYLAFAPGTGLCRHQLGHSRGAPATPHRRTIGGGSDARGAAPARHGRDQLRTVRSARDARRSAAYTAATPPVRKALPVPPILAVNGNAARTAADAMRAAHGIFHGHLLRPASRGALTTVRWAPENYALVGRVRQIDGDQWAWGTGQVEGYRAHIAHMLDESETIEDFGSSDMSQSTIGAGWRRSLMLE